MLTHCVEFYMHAVYMVSEATRNSLRSPKFQNFPGEHAPKPLSLGMLLHTRIPLPIQKNPVSIPVYQYHITQDVCG